MTRWWCQWCVCVLVGLAGIAGGRAEGADGILAGTVTAAGTTSAIKGALITAAGSSGTYTAISSNAGTYNLTIPAETYTVTCSASGYRTAVVTAVVKSGRKTVQSFALAKEVAVSDPPGSAAGGTQDPSGTPSAIPATLQADPAVFSEYAVGTVTLSSTIAGTVASYQWSQVRGPKVPLTATDATRASADVSRLEVAVDTELVFRLDATVDGRHVTGEVTVSVQAVDMVPILGDHVQVGGSTTAVTKLKSNGREWAVFNIGNRLCATPVGTVKGPVHTLYLPGFIQDIDLVTYGGTTYALVSAGTAGIVVVDLSDPAAMQQRHVVGINYRQGGISFAEGGGSILTGNEISSSQAPVMALETDGTTLYIADSEYGIHKTALANLLGPSGPVREPDGTLLIEQERFTLQYAGENPWGGPQDLKLYGGRLFVAMMELGLGIFDPATLEQVGGYNLYTDTTMKENWFLGMDVRQVVQKDPRSGEPYVDPFTGMPDYRQASFELLQVMRKKVDAPTPWADFDRYGKFYYKARSVDIAEFGGRTIAYIAYSLGGLVAVDISGFQTSNIAHPLQARYLGYVPAVPANGPERITGTQSRSLLPYYGAGMLKESGVIDVKVRGNDVFLTDHFAGLVIVGDAATPEKSWRNANGPYNNDTDGIPGNHFPDTEFVTSYDMGAYDPLDNESMPRWMYQAPCKLVTAEINGHGNRLLLMDTMDIESAGSVDIIGAAGAGGLNFIDIVNLNAPAMAQRYAVPVYFPTTDEIGATVSGAPGQTISVGHAGGIAASDRYVYLADGPHGVTAWKIVDDDGYPADQIHLTANTLQDEYPQEYSGVTVYPASHASNVVFDPVHQVAWSASSGLGLRRVDVSRVEAGQGAAGNPLLLPLKPADLFEHNGLFGTVKGLQYQDHCYDVAIRGTHAFVADGSNGLTVYDISKDPTVLNSGFFVGNIGGDTEKPPLGTASGVALWTNPADGRSYAFVAAGPRGVGVVDISDVSAMKLIKVFEPIKLEDGKVGAADGKAVDVKVVGEHAYFTYDSFGVVCYRLADLISPLPAGIEPIEVWKKKTSGVLLYDYRPVAVSRFKLQQVPGFEEWAGGAVNMEYTLVNNRLHFYVAFAEAGLVKIDWSDPSAPLLAGIAPTAGTCSSVAISNGRLYLADGNGGMLYFK